MTLRPENGAGQDPSSSTLSYQSGRIKRFAASGSSGSPSVAPNPPGFDRESMDRYHARCEDCGWLRVCITLDAAVGARYEHLKRHSGHVTVLRYYPRPSPRPTV